MRSSPLIAPAQYCIHDRIQFLELNIADRAAIRAKTPVAPRDPRSEPLETEDPSNAFGSASVCVDVVNHPRGGDELDAVPGSGEGVPPLEISARGGRDMAS